MKKTKLFGWAFVALASLSACTNDEEEVLTQESEIKLTSEITPSRVTSLDYQSTQIVKGQQVGVTITGAKSEHKNVAWNVGEEGELSNTGDPVYYGDGAATITAYHPFNDDWDENTSYAFSVNTDQSSEENYRNSDLLWATASSSKTETAIPLIFSHKLAKINVTLKSEDIEDLSGATISICGTNITTNFYPVDGTLSAATANIQEIKAGVTTLTAYTASAIVIPQTVANGTKFIKITHNDKTFYYTLSTNKELKSGCSHNYTLTIKEKEVTTESDKITDWEDDDNEGDAEEIETIPNNQIWYTSSYGKVTPYATDVFGANIVTNVYENGKGVITFDNDVTSIGDKAFYGYNTSSAYLTSITLPNSVTTIGNEAFYRCEKLADISMGKRVTSIGDMAFHFCYRLTSITLPNSLITLGESTFSVCTGLKKFKGKFASEDGLSLIINDILYSFALGCGATEYSIPDGITTIEVDAFAGCNTLKKVTLPNSLSTIKSFAFDSCPLESLIIPNGVTTLRDHAFYYCDKLASVTIGNGITSIERGTFYGCI